MAIGERIRFIRNLRGMTQKYLGMSIGFTEKTADVRMAQYESGARTPKENMTSDLANVLGVCPQALAVRQPSLNFVPKSSTALGLFAYWPPLFNRSIRIISYLSYKFVYFVERHAFLQTILD